MGYLHPLNNTSVLLCIFSVCSLLPKGNKIGLPTAAKTFHISCSYCDHNNKNFAPSPSGDKDCGENSSHPYQTI